MQGGTEGREEKSLFLCTSSAVSCSTRGGKTEVLPLLSKPRMPAVLCCMVRRRDKEASLTWAWRRVSLYHPIQIAMRRTQTGRYVERETDIRIARDS